MAEQRMDSYGSLLSSPVGGVAVINSPCLVLQE